MATPGRTFYDNHIRLLEANDVDGLIEKQYTDDAMLIGFDLEVAGRDALLAYFKEYMAGLGYLQVLSTDKFTESEDSILFEATIATAKGIARVYDVFYLRGGKAYRQWTGLLSFTPKEG